jgi:WD repeat-containing protein 49
VTQDRTGHRAQLVAVLFNPLFDVIVSVDESGAVCVWNLQDGARSGRFTASHGGESGPVPHVTAAALDSNQRRLVTGANDGSVRLWNFNNGSLLRR